MYQSFFVKFLCYTCRFPSTHWHHEHISVLAAVWSILLILKEIYSTWDKYNQLPLKLLLKTDVGGERNQTAVLRGDSVMFLYLKIHI